MTAAIESPLPAVTADPPARTRLPMLGRRSEAALVLAGYACLSALLYGQTAVGRLASVLVGSGPGLSVGHDQGAFVWFIEWIARSISQLRDPLSTVAIYAPHGWNLAWATSIPGPAALLTPVTLLAGPVVSFNLLALSAPALAAWTAYLLCREVLAGRTAETGSAADSAPGGSAPGGSTPSGSTPGGSTPGGSAPSGSTPGGSGRATGALVRLATAGAAPAIAGGLLFGFGSYETTETINHVNLAFVALVPLAPLLVLRRRRGGMSRPWFVIALGVLLGAQLLTSTEVLATMTMFGAIAFGLWLALADGDDRRAILRIAGEALAGLALAAVLSAPFLYQAFHFGNPVHRIAEASSGLDAANLLTATKATWLPGIGALLWSAHELHSNITEQVGYLGVPLLAMLGTFAWSFRRTLTGRWLIAFMLIVLLLALGGVLIVDGRKTFLLLPWKLIAILPLLKFAVPSRFVLYLWLAIAVAACLWLAQAEPGDRSQDAPQTQGAPQSRRAGSARRAQWARWALFGLVAVSLAPNLTGIAWSTSVDRPRLMESPQLARYVPPGSTVLALPYGSRGNSMLWQVESGFRFRMAGGYASFQIPPQYMPWSNLLRALGGKPFHRDLTPRLCSFLRFTGTTTILLRRGAPGSWHRLLGPLGVRPVTAGGFHVYRLGSSCPG